MKKRYVIISVALLALAAVAAVVVVLASADVIQNPLHKQIGREAAAEKAAAYIAQNYPELKDSPVYTSDDSDTAYWQFGYRRDETMTLDGESVVVPRIVIVSIDKATGEVDVSVSN
jgi:hypothetical protein